MQKSVSRTLNANLDQKMFFFLIKTLYKATFETFLNYNLTRVILNRKTKKNLFKVRIIEIKVNPIFKVKQQT